MPKNTVSVNNPQIRVAKVRRLLRKLRLDNREVAARVVGRMRDSELVVAAFEKQSDKPYRDWFFKTCSDQIWAQYNEGWKTDDGGSTWRLNGASLQLVRNDDGPQWNPCEIVALHCEPNELGSSLQSQLKRGPHIHVSADRNRLSHAHFPLNLCQLDEVMQTVDSLERAIETAIDVLRSEVIDRL